MTRIYLGKQKEAVLLGDAILAASAVGEYSSVEEACRRMCAGGKVIEPDTTHTAFHERKYRVFKLMYEHQREYNKIMEN
jgi:ribulose kinase